jgi:hypothetical protein
MQSMPRITSYAELTQTQGKTSLDDTDVFVVDGVNAVRKITAKELAAASVDKFQKISSDKPYGKSCFYRGANLGSGLTFSEACTNAQRSAIADGTFEGLFIGDYWTINNRIYRIADFDYWLRSGDQGTTIHHIVIVPDASFGNGQMNDINITEGAYAGSKMYTESSSVLNVARSTINTDFGAFVLPHRVYLPNAISETNAQSAGAWLDSKAELMNELMVYGSNIRCKKNSGTYIRTVDKDQLALFQLNPAFISPNRYSYWLRDVTSDREFANVDASGLATSSVATTLIGIRPAFAVKGTV